MYLLSYLTPNPYGSGFVTNYILVKDADSLEEAQKKASEQLLIVPEHFKNQTI